MPRGGNKDFCFAYEQIEGLTAAYRRSSEYG
jgi:hypothetical protein